MTDEATEPAPGSETKQKLAAGGIIDPPRGGTTLVAAAGWCAPLDSLFPEILAHRGGVPFAPKSPSEMTKKELRAEVERLRGSEKRLRKLLKLEQERRGRLQRKSARLLKLVGKLA